MSTITEFPKSVTADAPTRNVQLATTELLEKYDGRVPRYTSYPTAPHFSERVTPEVYASWLRDLPAGAPLSLYLHVPFCDSLCWFCGCNTTVVNRPEPVARYVELLLQEIDMVARAIGERREVSQIHLGGGSPTILTAEQVSRVFARLRHHFDVRSDAEIAVEIDPRGLSEDTIAAFAENGLTRASIGVQDVNPKVQDAINRIQSHETTTRCVELLRKHGVHKLNLDLMYGLPYQGIDDLRETVRQNLELSPDRVAVFGYAHVPWMKKHQKLIPEHALPGTEERWAQFRAAAERPAVPRRVAGRVGLAQHAEVAGRPVHGAHPALAQQGLNSVVADDAADHSTGWMERNGPAPTQHCGRGKVEAHRGEPRVRRAKGGRFGRVLPDAGPTTVGRSPRILSRSSRNGDHA